MKVQPWYHDGLRFQCQQCGSCCTGEPGYVWVNKEEIAALAAAVRLDVEEFQRRYVRKVGIRQSLIELPGGDCVFFHRESGSCQVYDQRPRQCRTWPFWHSNLATRGRLAGDVPALPGGKSRAVVPAADDPRPAGCLQRANGLWELRPAARGPTIARGRFPRLRGRRLVVKRRHRRRW